VSTVIVPEQGDAYEPGPDGVRPPSPRLPRETDTHRERVIVTTTGPAPDQAPRGLVGLFTRVGRWLRFVAGVDEAVMDKVKYLRAWYASLGAVVLMTGVIAGCSMWFAVQQATSAPPLVAAGPAVVWFVFIVVVDRWIISSRAGDGWQRFILLITRGTLALLFGVVIAEPLVLKVFENQIVQHVEETRAANLNQEASRYVVCNPDPADPNAPPAPSDCVRSGHDLGLATALAGQQRQLDELKQQEQQLRETLAAERAELARLQQAAMNECAGVAGPGLTGVYGEGINCRRNTEAANAYEASVPWTEQEALLLELQRQVADLQTTVTEGQRTFAERREAEIEARLAELPQPDEPIGLLERMEVLGELSQNNFHLLVGVWLVRLLFIAIDCSPVLMKIASGKTHYDRWVEGTLDFRVDMRELHLRAKHTEAAFTQDINEQERRRDYELQQRRLREQEVAARERTYLGQDSDR
jgi:hypothetical protein